MNFKSSALLSVLCLRFHISLLRLDPNIYTISDYVFIVNPAMYWMLYVIVVMIEQLKDCSDFFKGRERHQQRGQWSN